MKISKQNIGRILGPLVFFYILFYFNPDGLSVSANAVLATVAWVAIWWITEAIPIYVTALLPLILFPLTGGLSLSDTAISYGHKYIFLYMGGFILAIAIEKWDLHKRIALTIINLIGTNIINIILGFMLATAFLSMWISNTAATVIILPIAMAIVYQLNDNPETEKDENKIFGKALMLSIARYTNQFSFSRGSANYLW
jgi:sodium-dependent dicarboxylate transporter 2/3/5